jgi:glycolate oxidase FAD binding subunit
LSDPQVLFQLETLGVHAKRLEKPSTEREAQRILARAARERMTVLPVGGATALGTGVLPEAVDLVVDTTGLAKILVFDPRNLNLAVLAGMTLDAINEQLAQHERGFFLPLDPPLSHQASIGGIYAANLSGPSRLRYGTLRDQALGVRGVDAQGREVGFGGKTVKNVSGYDLTRFFIGSAGSLCLITSLSLRVYPLPEASSLCDLSIENLEGLEKFLSALRASVLIPSICRGKRILLFAFSSALRVIPMPSTVRTGTPCPWRTSWGEPGRRGWDGKSWGRISDRSWIPPHRWRIAWF